MGDLRECLYADRHCQPREADDVGESICKEGAELWRKKQVISDRREGRDGHTCLVNPCKVIISMQCP